MSRAALHNQQEAFYGHQAAYTPNMKQPPGYGGGRGGGGGDVGSKPPSRLLQMRDDYQKKLMKDKEERMVHMYEENTRKNQERTERLTRPGGSNMTPYPNSKLRQPGYNQPSPTQPVPSVRDFFRERREMEAKGGYVPPINHHYKQTKSRTGSGNSYYGDKNSAGVDRAQPLAPIQARHNGISSAPSQQQESPFSNKPRLVKHSQTAGNSPVADENDNYASKPVNGAKNGGGGGYSAIHKPQPPAARGPPPNSDRAVKRAGGPGPKEEKMTDFQKWQMDQNKVREDRLKMINTRAPPSGREGFEYEDEEEEEEEQPVTARGRKSTSREDEVARKQRELMERIAAQQADLERLRREREEEEHLERLEREELKRQQEADRERRKRQQQEEARQRREEEARNRREEEEERKMAKGRNEPKQNRFEDRNGRYEDEDTNSQPPSTRRSQPKPTPRGSNSQKNHQEQQQQNPPPKRAAPPPQRRPPPQSRRPQAEPEDEELIPVPGPGLDLYAAAEDDGPGGKIRLVPCKLCGRKFADDRIAKHTEACKLAQKKRKVYNGTQMRTEGTEMAKYVAKGTHKKEPPKKKKADWRTQHEDFINNIRYAKKVTSMEAQGMDTRSLAPPPTTHNPDLVSCPHCGRSFNVSAAERHIPRCKDLKTKPASNKRR